MPHSTLLMDLVLGKIDFVEVFQFGVLKTEAWYELLNAGLRVTGIAGSDFPGPLARRRPWPHWIPLLGPECTLMKRRPGGTTYETWAEGVRNGNVVVTNGPLVELSLDKPNSTVRASARFFRPLERLEIVRNGQVVAAIQGDGSRTALNFTQRLDGTESCWMAARVVAQRQDGEPEIQAHTNPVYLLVGAKPVLVRKDREALRNRWRSEVEWYKSEVLRFGSESRNRQFLTEAAKALEELERPLR